MEKRRLPQKLVHGVAAAAFIGSSAISAVSASPSERKDKRSVTDLSDRGAISTHIQVDFARSESPFVILKESPLILPPPRSIPFIPSSYRDYPSPEEEILEVSDLETVVLPLIVEPVIEQPVINELGLLSWENEKTTITDIMIEEDILKGIKGLSKEQRAEDMDMYFDIYKAAEVETGVPWFLLYIKHAHETTVSRHRNPEESGYVGAMQRDADLWPKEYLEEAITGWEFLRDSKDVRYMKKKGYKTNDVEEILFAAYKLRRDALVIQEKKPYLSDEQAIMHVLYSYSAAWAAEDRELAYQRAKIIMAHYGLTTEVILSRVA